jgi:hypothetical protein
MLLKSLTALALFEPIEIEIPEVGTTHAIVVWNSGSFFGCEFREPLSNAAIGAALLRSDPIGAVPHSAPLVLVSIDPATESPCEDDAHPLWEEDKAPLRVRLRVILGSAILLWAAIIWGALRLIKSLG